MIAIPQRKLWTPWDLPARRDWLRRLKGPWINPAAGDRLLDSSGNRMLDASGNRMLDGGSQICCLYQARDCATGTLQSLYVKKSQFPSFPSTYYFSYSGSCYYVQSTDKAACSATPVVSGETAVTSCSDSACGTPCPDGTGIPSSLTVTGWSGTFPDPGDTSSCNDNTGTVLPGMPLIQQDGGTQFAVLYYFDRSVYTCDANCCLGRWSVPLSGGGVMLLHDDVSQPMYLGAHGAMLYICETDDDYSYGTWVLEVNLELYELSGASGLVQWVGTRPNTNGNPRGTYALDAASSTHVAPSNGTTWTWTPPTLEVV